MSGKFYARCIAGANSFRILLVLASIYCLRKQTEAEENEKDELPSAQTRIHSMPRFVVIAFLSALVFSPLTVSAQDKDDSMKFRMVIHGGAGTIERSEMTPQNEEAHRAGLEQSLNAGYDVLARGGSSLDAVEAAIRILENNPLFNAGKGAVFTHEGTNELDASIMDGRTLKAGAVAELKQIRNPISLARLVMEKSPHVMLAGDGAEAFAKKMGITFVDQKYFYTDQRWQELQKEKAKSGSGKEKDRHGTVGAVALDKAGNLAAGTSTGGTTNKEFGRIGDSPVIGAGTYANDQTCAVSCTGDGEYFIRAAVAHDVSAMMEYKKMSVKDAAQAAIDKVARLGGTGGLIALDRDGNFAMPFNTSGMYRGSIGPNGKVMVEIYR
ncbi:MAG TPA: isoaspartyl peptidase/L-asparaginase [Chthoniobacterales bacterium]|nr:isoaspartyl peptidase/L-asparaginase [Chthoniobacterales bacterium]